MAARPGRGLGLRLPGSLGRPSLESNPDQPEQGADSSHTRSSGRSQGRADFFLLQISVALGDIYTLTYYEVKLLWTFGLHREMISI